MYTQQEPAINSSSLSDSPSLSWSTLALAMSQSGLVAHKRHSHRRYVLAHTHAYTHVCLSVCT